MANETVIKLVTPFFAGIVPENIIVPFVEKEVNKLLGQKEQDELAAAAHRHISGRKAADGRALENLLEQTYSKLEPKRKALLAHMAGIDMLCAFAASTAAMWAASVVSLLAELAAAVSPPTHTAAITNVLRILAENLTIGTAVCSVTAVFLPPVIAATSPERYLEARKRMLSMYVFLIPVVEQLVELQYAYFESLTAEFFQILRGGLGKPER